MPIILNDCGCMNLKSSPTRLPGMPLSRGPQVFDFDPDILLNIKPKIYGSRLNSIPGRRVGAVGLDPGSGTYRDDGEGYILG